MKCVSLNPLTKFKPKSPYLPTHLIACNTKECGFPLRCQTVNRNGGGTVTTFLSAWSLAGTLTAGRGRVANSKETIRA